jgi:hypothetical protein
MDAAPKAERALLAPRFSQLPSGFELFGASSKIESLSFVRSAGANGCSMAE